MTKFSLICIILTAVIWSFTCGYAASARDKMAFGHGIFTIGFTGLAIASIALM